MTTSDAPTQSMGHYTEVIRRRWIYPALIIPAAVLLAVYLAYTLSPVYRASATILLPRSARTSCKRRSSATRISASSSCSGA
jgi:uncharacterized protein involved in exopolysaccharide biosynthesis